MIVKVLVENQKGEICSAEHGLSYIVEVADKKILFDTGASNLFIENAQKIEQDLSKIETIVLSHGHYDHGDGLKYLPNKKLICHPGVFINRYRKRDGSYLGLAISEEETNEKFNVISSKKAFEFEKDVWFLGEIPRVNTFEESVSNFYLEDKTDDPIVDDSGIVIKTGDGIVLITGCAHSGVCNMIDHAISITGTSKIKAIIGGWHLKEIDERLETTIAFLKNKSIDLIYPSHCTSEKVIQYMAKHMAIKRIKSGDIISL